MGRVGVKLLTNLTKRRPSIHIEFIDNVPADQNKEETVTKDNIIDSSNLHLNERENPRNSWFCEK